jgi:hypothetical protein
MNKTWRLFLLIAGTFVFAVLALVVANSQDRSNMSGMARSKVSMLENTDSSNTQEMSPTIHAMSTKHMDMGPHLKTTEPQPAQ